MKIFKASILLLSLFAIIIFSTFYYIKTVVHAPIEFSQPWQVKIELGDTSRTLIEKLKKRGVIKSTLAVRAWLKLNRNMSSIKTGTYEFEGSQSVDTIFTNIVAAKVKQFSITLIEGLTLAQWSEVLKNTDFIHFDIQDDIALYKQLIALNDFCANSYFSLEGCFLSDTYYFPANTRASVVLTRAYLAMAKELNIQWQSRFQDVPYHSAYEVLIMASIIEKETSVAQERGQIAGVFVNRLEKNMRLQTDPTVIYGIGVSFDGNITRKHLRERTPYNTYVIKGLPITPIAMASAASLRAAVQPSLTDSLYFVAKGDGSHQFSETLEQHNAAVKQYQLKR